MLDKLKQYGTTILGFIVVVLGGILFNRNRKLQKVESELSQEKTTTEISLNEQAREAAKDNADALVDEYERLKRDD